MNVKLLKIYNPLVSLSRAKGYRHPGGIKYPGGIVYYPRNPKDHKDPEHEPSKLFRIERIKTTKHVPGRLRTILQELKIDSEEDKVCIVKNIPEINARLWKIKHLIRVTPITFPFGEPTAEDINYTVLKENGQCIVTKTLAPLQSEIEALDKFDNDARKMDSTTLKKDSRYKWNNAFNGGF